MEDLFQKHVILPVWNHPKSDYDQKFGYPDALILNEVLDSGLADFAVGCSSKTYGELTAKQRCQLYGFFNMKGHFFTALSNFSSAKSKLQRCLDDDHPTVLLDFGCGPATAGLAFCELFPDAPLRYYGVDRSQAMLDMGKELLTAAREFSFFEEPSRSKWSDNFEAVRLPEHREFNLVANFSYFFASRQLSQKHIRKLAGLVRSLAERDNTHRVLLSYTNTTNPAGTKNYKSFISELEGDEDEFGSEPETRTIEFRKKRNGNAKSITFSREVLVLK